MATIVRIPITNIFADGDYTGIIEVGPAKKPMNVLLDTGSSALALDGKKYKPNFAKGDQSTVLAQTDAYGDGSSWTGAVIKSTLTVGAGAATATLADGNVAIAYDASRNMFGKTDGILGLAYAPLDDAFQMAKDTSKKHYSADQVRSGKQASLVPYLTQLAKAGVISDILSFYTRRSCVHVGAGGANDPLNRGWVVVGGGEESTDLYSGSFQSVKVLSDEWYCTNLKAVIVGSSAPVMGRINGPQGMPTNSIIDSGTNSLDISPQMLAAILSKFPPAQKALLSNAIYHDKLVPIAKLRLDTWPTLTFVLQGATADVRLEVPPSNYWQVNTQRAGMAAAAITVGDPGLAILGLPLMNGYFTIFDGEADGGRGVVKFAKAKP
ncbi:MAG TPA: pepsin-like aspartic protease [Casimicrobiaceae bacterium]|nr:pepsin-like aspartic protease [Casimicrobiaceae bacterium]